MSSNIINPSLRNFEVAALFSANRIKFSPPPKVGARGRLSGGFRGGFPARDCHFFRNFAHIRQNPLYYKRARLKKFVEIFAPERIFLGNFHYG